MQIFDYIKASKFFPDFAPDVANYKKKIIGKNSNGNEIKFSESDKAKIKQGLKKIIEKL